jgi:hypothetical protein
MMPEAHANQTEKNIQGKSTGAHQTATITGYTMEKSVEVRSETCRAVFAWQRWHETDVHSTKRGNQVAPC